MYRKVYQTGSFNAKEKVLLAQKGFEWDEVQKMVVADDSLWNDYFKAHPDARLFHAKVIENYDDLCIILGNDQATGSCSENDDEIYLDLTADKEDLDSVIMSKIRSDEKQAKNLRWTEEMDCCLGKVLVEQVKMGYKIDNILQREAYNTAATVLNENFGPDLTKDHIRNRLRTWKKHYGVLKELLSHPGFRWDEKWKMIIVNDSVWNDYIKVQDYCSFIRWKNIFGNESKLPKTADALKCPGAEFASQIDSFLLSIEYNVDHSNLTLEHIKLEDIKESGGFHRFSDISEPKPTLLGLLDFLNELASSH
ncbi:hypothetical protein CK203_098677 [Vitis vinifera]|uniref:Myb/SANT-like domain-containing protein n=2 Tax=Vitis vinifera TaxID=29760 RepID=A0A438DIQ4_VITVI|nr:hypothetical protein CK203_098677 [Vitis vinifera]